MTDKNAKRLLAAVFAARGTSFLFSKTLMVSMPPMSILAVRFLLSFAVLAVVFWKKLINCTKDALKGGVLLGILYTITMSFEMFGLRLIESGVSSLIENTAVILVPLFLAILYKTLPEKKTIFCGLACVAGVGFLSCTQLQGGNGLAGILLMLGAASAYACSIITTQKVSCKADPIAIGMIQLGTMGVISLTVSLLSGSFVLPSGVEQWGMLLVLVLLCSCFGFTFQPVGQRYVSAETAGVLTVVNPFTASIFGILAGGESLSPVKLIGYALILGALLVYNRGEKTA